MPRRSIWSARQRAALLDLPTDEAALLHHYTLSDDDIEQIRLRRGGHNRLGFALQLCAFRYPGRILAVGEAIPPNVLAFIAVQLGMGAQDLDGYAVREETRWEHLAELRRIYGYKMFSGRSARDLKVWLEDEAEPARSNEGLARRFVEECRRRQVILPGPSVLERLCADALVAAERRIETRIAAGLDDAMHLQLDRLLTEEVDGGMSRFVWLRRFEVGRNSADINGLLDRLEFLQGFELPSDLLDTVPPHRIARLRRQGERYFAEGLRDISSDRRLAILGVCVVEWRGAIADAVVETHDRIVGQTFRSAKQRCDARLQDSRTVLQDTLHSFRLLGAALLEAKGDGQPLEEAVAAAGGWQKLEGVVAAAEQLNDTMSADPLAHVVEGWPRFRRYAPRMLRALDIQTSSAGEPIVAALRNIAAGSPDMPRTFLRRNSRWHQHLNARPAGDRRLWEVAALFHMRDAFRSGDIWLAHSPALRRCQTGPGVHRSNAHHGPAGCSLRVPGVVGRAQGASGRGFGPPRRCRPPRHDARRRHREWRTQDRPARQRNARGRRRACARPLSSPARGADHRCPAGGGCRHRFHRRFHPPALSIFTNFDHLNREMFTIFDRDFHGH